MFVVNGYRNAPTLTCPHPGQVSVGAFPTAVPSRAPYEPQLRAVTVYLVEEQFVPLGRVQQLLADLFSVRLGSGTLVGWVQQASQALAPVEAHIKWALQQVPVLHHDDTGVRCGGRLAWVHGASAAPAQRQRSAPHPLRYPRPAWRGGDDGDRYLAACHGRERPRRLDRQLGRQDLSPRALQYPSPERGPFLARYQELLAAGLAADWPPARTPPGPARARQAVSGAQSARTTLPAPGAHARLPRRPRHSLRQQSGGARPARAQAAPEGLGLLPQRSRCRSVQVPARLPVLLAENRVARS